MPLRQRSVGLSSDELPLFYKVVGCSTPACSTLLHVIISGQPRAASIGAHILPGTCVMSDMWKAYNCLKDESYTHLTVNHSLNFLDPDTGARTQRLENTCWGVKQSMSHAGTSKDLFENYLQEWLWR